MGQIVLLFAVLCSALLCAETQFYIGHRTIQFRKLSMCPGQKRLSVILENIVFTRDEHGSTKALSMTIRTRREIKTLAIVVNFQKCDASGNPDSCEYFLRDYNASNICEAMGKKNQLWTPFMDNFSMPPKCPIKVGDYYLKESPISPSLLNYVPVPNAFWKVNLKGYDQDVYLACIDLEFDVKSAKH